MSETTGKVIFKSIMWIAIGIISVITLLAPTMADDTKSAIIGSIVFFAAIVTILV